MSKNVEKGHSTSKVTRNLWSNLRRWQNNYSEI